MLNKGIKIFISIILGLIVIIAAGLITYKIVFSQKVAVAFEAGDPLADIKILVATQGSDFKDSFVNKLVKKLELKNYYIKVIDVGDLSAEVETEWKKIVCLSAIEAAKVHKNVINLIERSKNKQKIFLLATAGSGKWQGKKLPVDTFTSASQMKDIDSTIEHTIRQLEL